MTYWCSDHQQFEHHAPHTPDSVYNELRAERDRYKACLEKIAASGNVHPSWLVDDAKKALSGE
jgi:hypothetical protein